jgi:hypothetical protein
MRLPCFLFCTFVLMLAAAPASAESFLLKSGGQIDGELLNPKRNAADPYLVKTTEGMRVSLSRETVAKVVVVREVELEYQRLVPKVANTSAAHWEMAEWCREHGLRAQREQQLQLVLSLEPDHEHAHLALGHARLGGKWQKLEDYMKAQGYLKHEGQWRTRQDVEIALAREEAESEVINWRKQIRIWLGWIGKKREAEALTNLRQIRDPLAAPTLIDVLGQKGTSRDMRSLIVDVLAELKGNPAEGTFVKLFMTDPDQGVRDACLDHLVRTQSKWAVHQYMAVIKDKKSMPNTINQAAIALGRLKDPIATTALIDVLETTHEVLVTPGQSAQGLGPLSSSFGSDPGNPGSGGFSAGAAKPVKKKVTVTNDQVLAALTTLHPGVNFRFNEDAWRNWYIETHEPADINLRRAQ